MARHDEGAHPGVLPLPLRVRVGPDPVGDAQDRGRRDARRGAGRQHPGELQVLGRGDPGEGPRARLGEGDRRAGRRRRGRGAAGPRWPATGATSAAGR